MGKNINHTIRTLKSGTYIFKSSLPVVEIPHFRSCVLLLRLPRTFHASFQQSKANTKAPPLLILTSLKTESISSEGVLGVDYKVGWDLLLPAAVLSLRSLTTRARQLHFSIGRALCNDATISAETLSLFYCVEVSLISFHLTPHGAHEGEGDGGDVQVM